MTRSTIIAGHTDDCAAVDGAECEPLNGVWMEPERFHVSEAEAQLDDNAPWCRVHELAWRLQDDAS